MEKAYKELNRNNRLGLTSIFEDMERVSREVEIKEKQTDDRDLKLLASLFIIIFILAYILQEMFPWLNDRRFIPSF